MSGRLDEFEVVFCDVDGTLMIWPGDRPGSMPAKPAGPFRIAQPNKALVQELIAWKTAKPGRVLVVWTMGGVRHANWAIQTTGLAPYVDACLPKPGAIIDDGADKGKAIKHARYFMP